MALPTRVSRAIVHDPFDFATREMNGLINRLMGASGGRELFDAGSFNGPWGVDVREEADRFVVEAELPGFKKDEVDITLENNTLTITASRKEERSENGNGGNGHKGEYLLQERRYARYARSFNLPPTVDESSVKANLADGVLTVTLNKREEVKPRKVTVS